MLGDSAGRRLVGASRPRVPIMTTVQTPRPRTSLGRVLDDLGATLLDLVHGNADRDDEIGAW